MKTIRLIELFAGYGSQLMALKRLAKEKNIKIESYRVSEWETGAIKSYTSVHHHCENFDIDNLSFDKVMDCLEKLVISYNGKVPMTRDEMKRRGEEWCKKILRDMIISKNLGSVTRITGDKLGIVDKDKYTYMMTYSFPCFAGDTLVLTDSGYKTIKNVVTGDKVLTHDNTYQKVISSKMTGHKNTLRIKGMGIDEIVCTPNHKFYVRTKYRKFINGKYCRLFYAPIWKSAETLTKDDYLGVAINQNSIIPTWNGIDFNWSDGRKSRHKNEISKYLNNADFWWLVGRYVADGWIRSHGGIVIACGKHKMDNMIEHLNKLDFHYSVVEERTSYKIHFGIKELEAFVQPIGRGASNKTIPSYMFDMPVDLLKGFIDGYMSGDGCYTNGLYKASSVNKKLIYGLAQLVAKVYKQPYRIYKSIRNPTSIIENRTINQLPSYQLIWKTEKKKQDKAFYEDGFIWFPINKIEENKKVDVYDIEVENNHSFTANGVIVHNCTDLSLIGKQKGMDKDSGTGSSLLWEVDRILHECKELPQILLMENVTQVHSKKNKDNWLEWCRKLEELGYQNFVADLNAKDYGVPQNRKRCYMVSILKDSDIDCNFEFPKEVELTESIKDRLQSNPNEFVKFDMDRLKRISKWKSYQNPLDRVKGYEDIIPTITTRVMISDGGGINASTILVSSKLAKSCNLRQEVLDGKDLSYLDLRGLTTRECGRFMGVSDDDIDKMKEVCNYKELYKQFGNSIVVDVLYYIFKNLF